MPGWQTGASGTVRSLYGAPGAGPAPKQSAAWIAKNVRYRDLATADPPNKTLAHLPRGGVIVWAIIFQPATGRQQPIRLDFSRAKHFPCCEGEYVAGGEYELAGPGPGRAYETIVRIYFGSHPTCALRAEAQRGLNQLRLPASH